jgi:hypothetical protein
LRLLPRRALVALGLALSFVVSAAAPAQASWSSITSQSTLYGYDSGSADYYTESGTLIAGGRGNIFKGFKNDGTDRYSCAETWVDYKTNQHRPPDLYVSCPSVNNVQSGPVALHHPSSSGPPLTWAEVQRPQYLIPALAQDALM